MDDETPDLIDVEAYRAATFADLTKQIKDLKSLIESAETEQAAASLYLRLHSAIQMQNDLMGLAKQGPPPSDTVRYEIICNPPGLLDP